MAILYCKLGTVPAYLPTYSICI